MKKTLIASLIAISVLAQAAPGTAAGGGLKALGTDPALDAAPGTDLTGIAVAARGSDLHVRITMANPLPVQGASPGAGIQWTFDVRGRTFVAEAHPDPGGEFSFTLFEIVGEVFQQKASLEGAFDTTTGDLDMFVPLGEIGARKGTKISGTGPKGTEDVEVHQHAGPAGPVVDSFATTKDYTIPKTKKKKGRR